MSTTLSTTPDSLGGVNDGFPQVSTITVTSNWDSQDQIAVTIGVTNIVVTMPTQVDGQYSASEVAQFIADAINNNVTAAAIVTAQASGGTVTVTGDTASPFAIAANVTFNASFQRLLPDVHVLHAGCW